MTEPDASGPSTSSHTSEPAASDDAARPDGVSAPADVLAADARAGGTADVLAADARAGGTADVLAADAHAGGTADVLAADAHADLPARIDAARAMNRLSHALVAHRVDVSTLRLIATEADRLAATIEAQPRRDRAFEIGAFPRLVAAAASGTLADVIEDGAFIDLFHDSSASGAANPLAIGLRVQRDGDEAVGTVTLGPGWEGAPRRAHGGVVATCVDEIFGALLPIIGTMAFTGELNVRYLAPCPVGVPLEFRSRVERRDGRKLYLACAGTGPEGVFVEATAVFITIDLATFVVGSDASEVD